LIELKKKRIFKLKGKEKKRRKIKSKSKSGHKLLSKRKFKNLISAISVGPLEDVKPMQEKSLQPQQTTSSHIPSYKLPPFSENVLMEDKIENKNSEKKFHSVLFDSLLASFILFLAFFALFVFVLKLEGTQAFLISFALFLSFFVIFYNYFESKK
jgi:hypothetical protein